MVEPVAPSSLTLKGWMEAPLPDAVSWWPQTIGWKIIAIFVLFVCIRLIIWQVQIYRFNRYRREAQHALAAVDNQTSKSQHYYFQILKATAQYVNPHSATKYKDDFLAYLEQSAVMSEGCFVSDLGRQWVQAQLDPTVSLNHEQTMKIRRLCEQWIKLHSNPKQPTLRLKLK